MNEETRVRIGFKQTAKGKIQMDLTAEAPTVEKASVLLFDAIKSFKVIAKNQELEIVDG
jgi:hypothetical protein